MIRLRDAPARDLLGLYLNDHLAAQTALAALARRAFRNNRRTPAGEVLHRLIPELEEDRALLVDLIRSLGMGEQRWKQAAASVAERAGRAKLNGQLLGYSDLSRLVELEALIVGCRARLSLWRSVADLADDRPEVARLDPERLARRARAHLRTLEEERRAAARSAFSGR